MIKILDNNNNLFADIIELSVGNPFGCRISSLYKTYNYNLPFVDFWVQYCDGKAVSVISRLESSFILRLTDKSDIDEISSFIRISGAENLICDAEYELDLNMSRITGPILFSNSRFEINKSFDVSCLSAKDVYSIISQSACENFKVPSYESFMLDVNHKLNQRTIRMYGIKSDGEPSACIMTLAESIDSAVLGALSTAPKSRKKGYGAYLIKYINNILVSEGKVVYLHRAPDENIEFYNKLGFKQFGLWAEYKE